MKMFPASGNAKEIGMLLENIKMSLADTGEHQVSLAVWSERFFLCILVLVISSATCGRMQQVSSISNRAQNVST